MFSTCNHWFQAPSPPVTPVEVAERRLTHRQPFARCCLPPPNLEPPPQRVAIFAQQQARSSTTRCTMLSCSHWTNVRLLGARRARRVLRNLIVDNKGILLRPHAGSEQGIDLLEAANFAFEIFDLRSSELARPIEQDFDRSYLGLQHIPSCALPNELETGQPESNHRIRSTSTFDKHTRTSSRFLPPIVAAYLATNSTSGVNLSICSLSFRPLLRSATKGAAKWN